MRRLSVVLAVVALAPSLASAEETQRRFRLGILGEMGWSRLSITPSDPELATGSAARAGAGLSVDVRLTDAVSLEGRALFAHRGGTFTYDDEERVKASLDARYFTIPVLLKASAGHGVLRPYVVFGPEVGFNTRAKVSGSSRGTKLEEDVRNQVRDTLFGLDFGVGVERRGPKASTFLEVGYSLGLTNLAVGADVEERVKARNLTFNAGVRF
jgi:hypothetical protein